MLMWSGGENLDEGKYGIWVGTISDIGLLLPWSIMMMMMVGSSDEWKSHTRP